MLFQYDKESKDEQVQIRSALMDVYSQDKDYQYPNIDDISLQAAINYQSMLSVHLLSSIAGLRNKGNTNPKTPANSVA